MKVTRMRKNIVFLSLITFACGSSIFATDGPRSAEIRSNDPERSRALDTVHSARQTQIFQGDLPASAKEAFDSAFQLLKNGKPYDAIDAYEKAIHLASNSADIWMEYTGCLRQAHWFQQAARAGWRTIELDPNRVGSWGNLGNVFTEARAWDAATFAFKKAESLSSDKKWAVQNFLNLGFQQWCNGEGQLAIKTFRYAVEKDPYNGKAILDLGIAMVSEGYVNVGVAFINQALSTLKKEEGAQTSILYAEATLAQIRKEGKISPPVSSLVAFQKLPDRFLKQPLPGQALSLGVDQRAEWILLSSNREGISIKIPSIWKVNLYTQASDKVSAVIFRPKDGIPFEFFISLRSEKMTHEDVEAVVREMGRAKMVKSVEKDLELIEVQSAFTQGFIYLLTDEDLAGEKLKEGNYLYTLEGLVKTGNVVSYITTASQTKDQKFVQTILDILKSISPSYNTLTKNE